MIRISKTVTLCEAFLIFKIRFERNIRIKSHSSFAYLLAFYFACIRASIVIACSAFTISRQLSPFHQRDSNQFISMTDAQHQLQYELETFELFQKTLFACFCEDVSSGKAYETIDSNFLMAFFFSSSLSKKKKKAVFEVEMLFQVHSTLIRFALCYPS